MAVLGWVRLLQRYRWFVIVGETAALHLRRIALLLTYVLSYYGCVLFACVSASACFARWPSEFTRAKFLQFVNCSGSFQTLGSFPQNRGSSINFFAIFLSKASFRQTKNTCFTSSPGAMFRFVWTGHRSRHTKKDAQWRAIQILSIAPLLVITRSRELKR